MLAKANSLHRAQPVDDLDGDDIRGANGLLPGGHMTINRWRRGAATARANEPKRRRRSGGRWG